MPIYKYKYTDTGETFEVIQKMSDKPLKKHKGRKVIKIPSLCSFDLKGSGFYKNDYRE